ncbi:MAG: hypothetical protein K5829_01775 [Treponema sp.]|nr:hypothetical protein [Treponema sp.]
MRKFKLFSIAAITILSILFAACSTESQSPVEITTEITSAEAKTGVSTETIDERTDVIKIDGASIPSDDWTYIQYSLKDVGNNEITIDFSAEMKVVNTGEEAPTYVAGKHK